MAKLLEKGKFDGIFLADVLGGYDVYNGSLDAALRSGAQFPVVDPFFTVPAMAAVTKNLTFGVTQNTSYDHPYLVARKFSTLDHLTNGRVGINVVTGYLDSAARQFGNKNQELHAKRYEVAHEYMDVLYKLWESSWADDAIKFDANNKIYTQPDRVRAVNHKVRVLRERCKSSESILTTRYSFRVTGTILPQHSGTPHCSPWSSTNAHHLSSCG